MRDDSTGPQSAYASPGGPEPLELLRTPPPRERADAARNRAAILDAAARLFAAHGVEAVTMDQVAAEAGVGKGTVFRRFGDRSGLAVALLDARESDLQEGILSGPPPLGPGAPAAERVRAFTRAYLDHLLAHLALVRVSETASPGARHRVGAYRFWHRHLTILLTEAAATAGTAGADPAADAHTLLAALGAEHVAGILPDLGEARVRAAADRLAVLLAGG